MSATLQDNLNSLKNPMVDALYSRGITPDTLAKQLKAELKAKETKFIKIKKNAKADEIIAQMIKMVDGKEPAKKRGVTVVEETTEEKIIAINVRAWGVQQRAREDAQKLLDLYPAEKHQHNGQITILKPDNIKKPKESGT